MKLQAQLWLTSQKNQLASDLKFIRTYSELLTIWTLLYSVIFRLYLFALAKGIFVWFGAVVLSVLIAYVTVMLTIQYIYRLKYGHQTSPLVKIHKIFN